MPEQYKLLNAFSLTSMTEQPEQSLVTCLLSHVHVRYRLKEPSPCLSSLTHWFLNLYCLLIHLYIWYIIEGAIPLQSILNLSPLSLYCLLTHLHIRYIRGTIPLSKQSNWLALIIPVVHFKDTLLPFDSPPYMVHN